MGKHNIISHTASKKDKVENSLGVTSEKKNRRFEDKRQIGEGGSSSNQKYKMISISDIF